MSSTDRSMGFYIKINSTKVEESPASEIPNHFSGTISSVPYNLKIFQAGSVLLQNMPVCQCCLTAAIPGCNSFGLPVFLFLYNKYLNSFCNQSFLHNNPRPVVVLRIRWRRPANIFLFLVDQYSCQKNNKSCTAKKYPC